MLLIRAAVERAATAFRIVADRENPTLLQTMQIRERYNLRDRNGRRASVRQDGIEREDKLRLFIDIHPATLHLSQNTDGMLGKFLGIPPTLRPTKNKKDDGKSDGNRDNNQQNIIPHISASLLIPLLL